MKSKTLIRLIFFYAVLCQVMPMSINSLGSLGSSQKASLTYKTSSLATNFGGTIASVGDINGDGISDFVVGSSYDNLFTGKVAVIYGVKGGLPSFDISSMTSSQGYTITGTNMLDYFGTSIAGLGDVNGDKINDFIIGASGYGSNAGAAFVIYGKSDSSQTSFAISSLTTSQGFAIAGTSSSFNTAGVGTVVAKAGDFDNDGINDFLVSCPKYAGGTSGRVYVIYGVSGTRSTIDLASVSPVDALILIGRTGYKLGGSMAPLGDINGDKNSDIAIDASGLGRAIILYGISGKTTTSISADSFTSTEGFSIYDNSGQSKVGVVLAGEGDINGDGKLDLVVTGSNDDGVNMIYVITNIDGADIDVSNFQSKNGFKVSSKSGAPYGSALNIKGDVNGDKIDDLIIGANFADPGNLSVPGGVFVVYGKKSGLQDMVMENSADVVLYGTTSASYFGAALVSNGDFNNDGNTDVIIGAPYDNTQQGAAYVVYGGSCSTFGSSCTSSGLSGGAIAGIVVGSVAGAALIGVGIWYIVKRKRSSTRVKTVSANDNNQKKNKKANKGDQSSNQELNQKKQEDHVLLNSPENDGMKSPQTADKRENI